MKIHLFIISIVFLIISNCVLSKPAINTLEKIAGIDPWRHEEVNISKDGVQYSTNRGNGEIIIKKITPKSIFTVKPFNKDGCEEGFKIDSYGNCVNVVQFDESLHLDFLLQRLTAIPQNEEDEDYEDEENDTTRNPLQFNIPFNNDYDYTINGNISEAKNFTINKIKSAININHTIETKLINNNSSSSIYNSSTMINSTTTSINNTNILLNTTLNNTNTSINNTNSVKEIELNHKSNNQTLVGIKNNSADIKNNTDIVSEEKTVLSNDSVKPDIPKINIAMKVPLDDKIVKNKTEIDYDYQNDSNLPELNSENQLIKEKDEEFNFTEIANKTINEETTTVFENTEIITEVTMITTTVYPENDKLNSEIKTKDVIDTNQTTVAKLNLQNETSHIKSENIELILPVRDQNKKFINSTSIEQGKEITSNLNSNRTNENSKLTHIVTPTNNKLQDNYSNVNVSIVYPINVKINNTKDVKRQESNVNIKDIIFKKDDIKKQIKNYFANKLSNVFDTKEKSNSSKKFEEIKEVDLKSDQKKLTDNERDTFNRQILNSSIFESETLKINESTKIEDLSLNGKNISSFVKFPIENDKILFPDELFKNLPIKFEDFLETPKLKNDKIKFIDEYVDFISDQKLKKENIKLNDKIINDEILKINEEMLNNDEILKQKDETIDKNDEFLNRYDDLNEDKKELDTSKLINKKNSQKINSDDKQLPNLYTYNRRNRDKKLFFNFNEPRYFESPRRYANEFASVDTGKALLLFNTKKSYGFREPRSRTRSRSDVVNSRAKRGSYEKWHKR